MLTVVVITLWYVQAQISEREAKSECIAHGAEFSHMKTQLEKLREAHRLMSTQCEQKVKKL